MRLNSRGRKCESPRRMGKYIRNISQHYNIMVLFTSSTKSPLEVLCDESEVKPFYVMMCLSPISFSCMVKDIK